jgi:uncharacterized membrane protein YjgN (DUF898 family)
VRPATPEGSVAPSDAPTPTLAPYGRTGELIGFTFDGGAGTFLGTGILAFLVTVFSLGIAYPFALVLRQRWIAKHTMINGVRLRFTGTGVGLFGNWIKWLLLSIVTIGIYLLWVGPRIHKWKTEHTEFDRASAQPEVFIVAGVPYRRVA